MEEDSGGQARSRPHEHETDPPELARSKGLIPRLELLDHPQTLAAIVEAARTDGVPPKVSWAKGGGSVFTYDNWLYAYTHRSWKNGERIRPETLAGIDHFFDAVFQATAEHDAKMASVISKAAESYNEKTGIPEWRAAAWNLEHGSSRKDWYVHRDVAVTDTRMLGRDVAAEHKVVRALTDDELLELNPQYRGLLEPPDASFLPEPHESADPD